ncbi:hypothetical protein BGZ98_005527, partial [Dissophora globulifera]
SRRLKQQLQRTSRSFDDTRVLPAEERNKHQEAIVSKQQRKQLLEKIKPLYLLSESNTMWTIFRRH